jgi:hypothetical protein
MRVTLTQLRGLKRRFDMSCTKRAIDLVRYDTSGTKSASQAISAASPRSPSGHASGALQLRAHFLEERTVPMVCEL